MVEASLLFADGVPDIADHEFPPDTSLVLMCRYRSERHIGMQAVRTISKYASGSNIAIATCISENSVPLVHRSQVFLALITGLAIKTCRDYAAPDILGPPFVDISTIFEIPDIEAMALHVTQLPR
ncbi:hypothetical protein DF046_19570 [Burkholderia cepacia]|nr:hypothetical protein DF046_19570 [Burkholderia cepacia]